MPSSSVLICTETRKAHNLKWGGDFIDTSKKDEVIIDCTKCECYDTCPNTEISRLQMFNESLQRNLLSE